MNLLLTKQIISIIILVTCVIVACLFVRHSNLVERHLIFFPKDDISNHNVTLENPKKFGLKLEDVYFQTSDNLILHGWYIPGVNELTLLWFHGNAGNIGNRVANIKELHQNLGANIFIFDYRGYGRSQGTPSEEGTYVDGDAAIAYLSSRSDNNPSKIIFFGRSLGAAVATEMAIRNKPYALILESGFPSIQAMANQAYPFIPGIGYLTNIFSKTKYDTIDKLRKITSPVMIIHGDRDTIVPYEFGMELYKVANSPKSFYTVKGGDHNNTYRVGGKEYYDAIVEFLSDSRTP